MANTFNLGNGNWAQKTEKLLAYNAENDNYKPLPFDFDRGSTATRVNRDGLIETVATDEPRIDFLNNTKGHLLLEPSRQNKYTYSEDFTQWSSSRLETPVAEIVSPDGSVNGYKMQQSSGFTSAPVVFFGSVVAGTYTISIFAKKGTRNYIAISFDGVTYFDVENGVVGSIGSGHTPKIENYGNGWYRCSITKAITTSQASAFYFADRDNSLTSNDDEGYMYAFGAQLEQGSYATSYIPTSGSTVTRSVDVCNNAGNSNVFNDSEGVLYAEIAALANDGTTRRFSISDGSYSNRITLELDETSNTLKAFIVSANTTYYSPSEVLSDITNYNKIAIKYKQNDFSLWVNGFEFDVDNSGNTPINLSQMQFADGNGSDVPFYGKVKDLRVYNTALSDSELQALTQV